jgi:retron-type reverse transcriptase
MLGLPVIQNMDDFTEKTHISKYTLFQLSRNSDKYYKIYTIPKKSGKLRTICQPSKKLKGLQAWILVNILNKLKVSDSCRGFEKGSSIAENASAHIGANTILNLDLKDFFSTINQKQVFNIFKSIGYNNTISVIFSNICTYNQKLPQGSPCSPKLANLCSWRLDVRIQGYVGKRGIIYTRYADDMSFSGNSPNNVTGIISVIGRIINSENFSLNKSKTRYKPPDCRWSSRYKK